MALISCPVCDKKISSVAKQCQHCQANLEGDLSSQHTIRQIQKSTQLMNQSFVAMFLFILGMVLWFWNGEPAEGTRAMVAILCFVFGFVGYLICRLRLILHKRKNG